jgi:hypothetical protein
MTTGAYRSTLTITPGSLFYAGSREQIEQVRTLLEALDAKHNWSLVIDLSPPMRLPNACAARCRAAVGSA